MDKLISSLAIFFILACYPEAEAQKNSPGVPSETGPADIETMSENLNRALAAIEALTARVDALESDLDAAQAKVAEFEGITGGLRTDIDVEQETTAEIQTLVSNLESLYSPLRSEVTLLGHDLPYVVGLAEANTYYVAETRDTTTAAAALLAYIRTEGTDVIVEGANVHVRNGAGRTDAVPNGLGNVVIGYGEAEYTCQGGYNHGDICIETEVDCDGGWCSRVAPPITTGSHNLIIGPRHDYSSHSCLLAGDGGDATEGPYCVVLPAH